MGRSKKNGLTVSNEGSRPWHIYFTKKASRFNNCVGDKLRGGHGSRQDRKAAFSGAVQACRGVRGSK